MIALAIGIAAAVTVAALAALTYIGWLAAKVAQTFHGDERWTDADDRAYQRAVEKAQR